MILLIDNYDSFVYNLARYVNELGFECLVIRNDAVTIPQIRELNPSHIILSPGPCTPDEAGICLQLVRELQNDFPMLGVCLGHQTIAQAFGGIVEKARFPTHGKARDIQHDGKQLFENCPNPMKVGRYHSLIVSDEHFPNCLTVTARCLQGEIMAIQHGSLPIFGVQFHPESVLTESGYTILRAFLENRVSV